MWLARELSVRKEVEQPLAPNLEAKNSEKLRLSVRLRLSECMKSVKASCILRVYGGDWLEDGSISRREIITCQQCLEYIWLSESFLRQDDLLRWVYEVVKRITHQLKSSSLVMTLRNRWPKEEIVKLWCRENLEAKGLGIGAEEYCAYSLRPTFRCRNSKNLLCRRREFKNYDWQ